MPKLTWAAAVLLGLALAGAGAASFADENAKEPEKLQPANAYDKLALARMMTKSACSCLFVMRRSAQWCTSTDTSIWRLFAGKPSAFAARQIDKRPDRGHIDFPFRDNGEFVIAGAPGERSGAVSFVYDGVVLSRSVYARANPGCMIEF